MKPELRILTAVLGAKAVERVHLGRKYLMAPAVLLREGVFHGNGGAFKQGPVFISGAALAQAAENMNSAPALVRHPGSWQTGLEQKVIEDNAVGQLFQVKYDKARGVLSGEVWIDIEVAERHPDGPDIMEKALAGTLQENSVGATFMMDFTPGTFKGKKFGGSVDVIIPTHYAILTDEAGACKIADGCGIGQLSEAKDAEPEEAPGWFFAALKKYFPAKDDGDEPQHNPEVVMNEEQKAKLHKHFVDAGLSEAQAITEVKKLADAKLSDCALKAVLAEAKAPEPEPKAKDKPEPKTDDEKLAATLSVVVDKALAPIKAELAEMKKAGKADEDAERATLSASLKGKFGDDMLKTMDIAVMREVAKNIVAQVPTFPGTAVYRTESADAAMSAENGALGTGGEAPKALSTLPKKAGA